MANLKKQSEVLNLLHKKNETELESISVELKVAEEQLSIKEQKKKKVVFKLEDCNDKLLANSGESLDVSNLIAMHSYASKLEQDIGLLDKQIEEKSSELDSVRERLEEKLIEGKLYEKAAEKKEQMIQKQLEASQEVESQELWLSGRVNR